MIFYKKIREVNKYHNIGYAKLFFLAQPYMIFLIIISTVSGPTPPGTGVINLALGYTYIIKKRIL